MNTSRKHARVLWFAGLQFLVLSGGSLADPGLPRDSALRTAEADLTQASNKKPLAGCANYNRCIALGKQLLDEKNPQGATVAFQQAVALADQNDRDRAEAYGHLAKAQEASGDRVAARAYLERARTLAPEKGGWIESEYKHVLASQGTLTAADIQRKLALDKEIAQNETPMQVAAASADDTPGAGDDSEYTAEMGQTRGIGLDVAMVDDNDQYAPKPGKKAAKPAPVAKASAPKPATKAAAVGKPKAKARSASAAAGTAGNSFADQPSLDLRINFEYNSAVLTSEGKQQADELGKALEQMVQESPEAQFVLLGHTDMLGSEQYNLSLSKDRAESVRAYLARAFPDLNRTLRAEGAGKRQPLFDTSDDQAQSLNRRVEVKRLR